MFNFSNSSEIRLTTHIKSIDVCRDNNVLSFKDKLTKLSQIQCTTFTFTDETKSVYTKQYMTLYPF